MNSGRNDGYFLSCNAVFHEPPYVVVIMKINSVVDGVV